MIPGIEVLSQEEILYTPIWAFVLVAIGLIMLTASLGGAIASLGGAIASSSKDQKSTKPLIRSFVVFCIAIIIGYVGCANLSLPTESYTYDVTISDEAKLADFLEQYEIIDQKGKVYTIREKNLDRKKSHELWVQHNVDKGNDTN